MGNDRGRQYRTGIYYQDEADLPAIYTVVQGRSMLGRKIAVEIGETSPLYLAEDYHQDYLKKNPSGYAISDCDHLVLISHWLISNYKPSQSVKGSLSEGISVPKKLLQRLHCQYYEPNLWRGH